MHDLFQYVCIHASYAPFVLAGLLYLSAINVPISEDLILLTAGALVSQCVPDEYVYVYIIMYLGVWTSGWITYWIGRLFGPKLYHIRWFKYVVTPQRIERLHYYYEKWGIWTFIVGRFCPGGVRNALIITSGMGKMPFPLYMLRDGVAALISTSVIFYLGHLFGENYDLIVDYFKEYNEIGLVIIAILLIVFFLKIYFRLRKDSKNDDTTP